MSKVWLQLSICLKLGVFLLGLNIFI